MNQFNFFYESSLNGNFSSQLQCFGLGELIFQFLIYVLLNTLRNFAYKPEKSCNDAFFTTRKLGEKCLEKKTLLFVDFQKVFWSGSQKHSHLGTLLLRYTWKTYWCHICWSKITVNVAEKSSEEFEINIVLYQGLALSPLLFIKVEVETYRHCNTVGIREILIADHLVIIYILVSRRVSTIQKAMTDVKVFMWERRRS